MPNTFGARYRAYPHIASRDEASRARGLRAYLVASSPPENRDTALYASRMPPEASRAYGTSKIRFFDALRKIPAPSVFFYQTQKVTH